VKTFCRALAAIFLLCITGMALAETYPQRPVRVIMPTAPGGGSDVPGRVVAQKLWESFGKQFFVENIPGAGTNIGIGTADRAKPDGHTILVAPEEFGAYIMAELARWGKVIRDANIRKE